MLIEFYRNTLYHSSWQCCRRRFASIHVIVSATPHYRFNIAFRQVTHYHLYTDEQPYSRPFLLSRYLHRSREWHKSHITTHYTLKSQRLFIMSQLASRWGPLLGLLIVSHAYLQSFTDRLKHLSEYSESAYTDDISATLRGFLYFSSHWLAFYLALQELLCFQHLAPP